MEAALGWLGDIIRALIRFIPSIILVKYTHAGVKFACGSDVKLLRHNNGIWWPRFRWGWPPVYFKRCGIHVYWPLVTEFEQVPIKRQTSYLKPQYLVTHDNVPVGVRGIVIYEVSDVQKLLTETYGYDDTVQDYALATIKEIVCTSAFEELQREGEEVDKRVAHKLKIDLRRFGVAIVKVTLSDFTRAETLGLWGTAVEINSSGEEV